MKKNLSKKYNWKAIQDYYNGQRMWQDVIERFGLSAEQIYHACKLGEFRDKNLIDPLPEKLNWLVVEEYYYGSRGWDDLTKKFGITTQELFEAVRDNLFETREMDPLEKNPETNKTSSI